MITQDILAELSAPMPYKWRVQSFSKRSPKATCVAYISSRDAMQRLDDVCSKHGLLWSRSHEVINGNMFCTITITDGVKSVSRADCGTESNQDAEKGESSDSFKRAAINFGVGRFLYDLAIQYVDSNEVKTNSNYPYPVDQNGKRIWDLTKHINSQQKQTPQLITDADIKAIRDCLEKNDVWEATLLEKGKLKALSELTKDRLPKVLEIIPTLR